MEKPKSLPNLSKSSLIEDDDPFAELIKAFPPKSSRFSVLAISPPRKNSESRPKLKHQQTEMQKIADERKLHKMIKKAEKNLNNLKVETEENQNSFYRSAENLRIATKDGEQPNFNRNGKLQNNENISQKNSDVTKNGDLGSFGKHFDKNELVFMSDLDKNRLFWIEEQLDKLEKERNAIFQRVDDRKQKMTDEKVQREAFINKNRYKKEIGKRASILMQNEKLSQNDASFLLRTISSMWKDQVPIKDAWNCVKDISKKIANSRDAKNPLNKSADDILESKQISLQKPNYQVLDKPSPEKPKITDNRLSPEKSETVLQNGDFSEYSISQEEYYDESDENDINGRYDFSISMDRDQNSDSSNDIRKDDSEESEGDSPGLNLAEHDENKPTINVSAFRRILRNNLYDVNRDDRNQDEILEALKDENKIGSKFDSKMRKIFDTPKNYESMSNDNEPVGTTEETECRRCTYSFPLTDKNCPMCGAAKNYEEPELWRCARCNSENGFKGKNKLFCEFCYSKET